VHHFGLSEEKISTSGGSLSKLLAFLIRRPQREERGNV
jgi:hypothetical protein